LTTNITVHIRYSQPRPEDVKDREYDSIGHVDIDLLKELLPNKDIGFYICGLLKIDDFRGHIIPLPLNFAIFA
jgi:Na+-transporting NADH:ubiquinone oxidoreductase subunit NqrF